jgi:hypothetical protein
MALGVSIVRRNRICTLLHSRQVLIERHPSLQVAPKRVRAVSWETL